MAVPAMGAAIANTYFQRNTTHTREDLADIIYRVDSDETPLVSALTRKPSRQTMTEWLVQTLAAADDNFQPEGFTATFHVADTPTRLNNICQILARTVSVSNTTIAADTVGAENEYERQLILRGMEVRRDLERVYTSDQAKATTDPRKMAGLAAYCTNGSAGAGTGAMPTGDGSNSHTAGTARALTLALVVDAMQAAFTAGGKPTLALMGPSQKRKFSDAAAGGAGNPVVADNIVQHTSASAITIIGATNAYLTDFGTLQLAPDRFIGGTLILLIDTNHVESAPLNGRDFFDEEYAKTGDSRQGGCVFEGCIRPTAPKAHAAIFDLTP